MHPFTHPTPVKVGNQKALMNLGDWKGAKEWEESMRGVWLSDGNEEDDGGRRRPLGYVKVSRGVAVTARASCRVDTAFCNVL